MRNRRITPLVLFTLLSGCPDDTPPPVDAGERSDLASEPAANDVPGDTVDVPFERADGGTDCGLSRVLLTTSNYVTGAWAFGPFAPIPSALSAPSTFASDQDHVPVQSGCLVFDLLRGDAFPSGSRQGWMRFLRATRATRRTCSCSRGSAHSLCNSQCRNSR